MTDTQKPNGRRVLVAAALPQTRSFLSVLLADRGFETEVVGDGPTLLDSLRRKPPAATVIDFNGSGVDWARRARHAAPDVPLVLIADGHDLTPEEAADLADGYLLEPVRPDELLFTLHRLLRGLERGDRLRHAQRIELLGRLTGGVVHDVNNLVTVMLGRSEMLLDAGGDAEAVLEHGAQIREAASRASSLTRRLLAFSRRQNPRRVRLSLNGVLADMSRLLRSMLPAELDVRTDLDPAVADVEADVGELEQVVMNLVLNARDAMLEKAGGGWTTNHRLTLRTYPGEMPDGSPAAVLAVRDTGCGMSAEVRERIFEPFYTTKPPGKGTGLGMAIVADIVRQCDGRIEVTSAEGLGTEFQVLLPHAPPAALRVPAALPPRNGGPSRGTETVLLAEDNDQVAGLTASVLRGSGYSVLVARDGPRAVEVGRGEPRLDLLVADLGLPGMSGHAVAERLLAARPGLKVLFISGEARPEGWAAELGGMPLLEKPFSPADLAQRVRQVLDG
jgi:two-component system cell cycle sensor histidine kinase/response regulator CckA